MARINPGEKDGLLCKTIFIMSIIFLMTCGEVKAQESLDVIRGESSNNSWLHFSDAPNSLYHHLAGQAFEQLEHRSVSINEMGSADDWQRRQEHLKEVLMDITGPYPEKTPLNATVTRTIQKDDYKVEHIVYESRPGFFVTSSMFIPDGLGTSQAPAILYVSGHYEEAYRNSNYQHLILNLVKKGFIVFAIDPVGQGERLEYYDRTTGSSMVGGPTSEHSYPGAQAFISGSSQAHYMIWDGIRAVDYLQEREEVDPDRIGITGMSGGGTQAAYIAAMDERIYASAPGNYITSFTRLLQTIGPQDAEQNLFHGIANGIDHADLLSVRAPKPVLIKSTTNDFFSIQGARETAKEVSVIYEALGSGEKFGMVEDDGGHTVTRKNREAMYAFFQQHLDNPGSPDDQETDILSEDEIQVTKSGQVSRSYGGETVFSLNRMEAGKQLAELQQSRINLGSHLPGVLEAAEKLSGYQEPETVDNPVFTGRFQRSGYVIEKYFVKGEGDYVIPYLLMVPDNPNGKSVIYLHPSGKAAQAAEGGEMEWFARNGFTVLAPDLAGIGEMGAGGSSELRREWRASILIGRSIVGIRAGDIVRLTRLLQKNAEEGEIYGVARKELGPVLLHAAVFEPAIERVALLDSYSSYSSIVLNRFYDTGFIHSTVAGALTAYDLPDLAASLAPRKLMMAGITDGAGKPVSSENLQEDISIIKTAYQHMNAPELLSISGKAEGEKLHDLFKEWIK